MVILKEQTFVTVKLKNISNLKPDFNIKYIFIFDSESSS